MTATIPTDIVVDVLILTALQLEYDSVKQVNAGGCPGRAWREYKTAFQLPIAFREFEGKAGNPLQVAVTLAGAMGPTPAATALTPLVLEYRPSCVAMAGVCAGRPGYTNLGDVIAADRLYFHDTGKRSGSDTQQDLRIYELNEGWVVDIRREKWIERFRSEDWWQGRPIPLKWQENWVLAQLRDGCSDPGSLPDVKKHCPQWSKVIEGLFESHEVRQIDRHTNELTDEGRSRIDRLLMLHQQSLPDVSPLGHVLPFKVHVAPMASGQQVIEDDTIWGFVSQAMRKTQGVEMEAAAIGYVAKTTGCNALVMKGVMDFAQQGRDDHFKAFAARASAECLLAALRALVDPKAANEPTARRTGRSPVPTVLPVGRSPVTIDHRRGAVLGRPAHRVAIAALLGRWVQDDAVFRRACEAARMPHELFWAGTSRADRWHAAMATSEGVRRLSALVETAGESLHPTARWRLLLDDSDAVLKASSWDRNELYKYRQQSSDADASLGDVWGLRALQRLWDHSVPDFPPLRRYLDERSEVARNAEDHNSGHGPEDEREVGLAAEHLLKWCIAPGGNELVAWAIEHAGALSTARLTLLAAMFGWWPEGRTRVIAASRAVGNQSFDSRSNRAAHAALVQLVALDRVAADAGEPWWEPAALPPSVRLAERLQAFTSIAELLEELGERRPQVWCEQIARLHPHRDAVVSLTRALRRLRIAGLEGGPENQELAAALRCSLPDVTDSELEILRREPRVRAWWLDLLSPPLSESQVGALVALYGRARVPSERDRIRLWLCTGLDLTSVWRRLPHAWRFRWVEELTGLELRLVAHAFDRASPTDAPDDGDWRRLKERVAQTKDSSEHFS